MCLWICCFFVKQKAAYELRISDWISDVCSSDLMASLHVRLLLPLDLGPSGQHRQLRGKGHRRMQRGDCRLATAVPLFLPMPKSKFYAPNFYAGVPLDRADRLRADAERLAAFLRDRETRVVPMCGTRPRYAAKSEGVVVRLGESDGRLGGAGRTT